MRPYYETTVALSDRAAVSSSETTLAAGDVDDGYVADDVDLGSHAAWFIAADSETDTATVQYWYWSGTAWCKGGSKDITGSTVVRQPTLGDHFDIRLGSVSGTFALEYRVTNQGD